MMYYLFVLFALSSPINIDISSDLFCSCRTTSQDREYEICYCDANIYIQNVYGLGNVASSLILFQSDASENCFYLFNMPVTGINIDLFPEAKAACIPYWDFNRERNIFLDSSTSISPDGRFIIPYCYGVRQLIIYEIEGITRVGEFRFIKSLNLSKGIEALRIFKDFLFVLDAENINAYTMKRGREFKKVSHFSLPHRLYKYHLEGPQYEGEAPTFMLGMAMEGNYLYMLNPPGNDYGPLLTFKIEYYEIILVDDGRSFPIIEGDYAIRNNIQINEVIGEKYLTYIDQDCYRSAPYWGTKYLMLFRLENNIPTLLRKEEKQCFTSYLEWAYSFKNDYLYEHYAAGADELCPNQIFSFGNDEQFRWQRNQTMLSMTQGPDTELIDSFGRTISCSNDDLPVIEHLILPDKPVSGNFLAMGTARDSEGIRRVFAGFPLCYNMTRASVFNQGDKSVIWMAVISEIEAYSCPVYWTECINDFTYMSLAEDTDGDSNQSPDAPGDAGHVCIQFNPHPDPLPFGSLEDKPDQFDEVLAFSGWALDNSGIWQGWLFSEDAQVLVPIGYGCERPDVAEQYPEYPESLRSGFAITFDTGAIPEGDYEFTLRILAKDYQVLDFGPFTISISRSGHRRPVSPP